MPADTPTLSITFRSDLNLLIARWLRDVSKSELQQGYTEVLQAAIRHQAGNWLIDSRRRSQSNAEMVDWLAQEYLPELSPALNNRPVHLACLVAATWQPGTTPATPLAVLAQSSTLAAKNEYQVQLFSDEGAATSWLQQTANR
ncbi:hypothetical protein [Hymenobacter psychrophilus]|uniref:SpoIIAA-like n=1 Tax=Hymenobacter psychrophilus TaxID=651662 RepID=A0A1H3CLT5_9BACT|nr:hypothetical protein [Hymenobacter psychrophilus]SDX55123.1 hypothetical protein SAMN04488069_10239 [Hymenobacter psychrophilus]